METQHAYRNALALSLLVVGLAFLFLSIGGLFQTTVDIVNQRYEGESGYEWAYGGIVAVVALFYLFIGISLIQARPRQRVEGSEPAPPEATGSTSTGWRLPARLLSLSLVLLGVVLLFNFTPYGRDSGLAAVLMLAGGLAFLATLLLHRHDANVQAAGAIVGLLAGALLLYAQLQLTYVAGSPGTWGVGEITNLVLPPVLGALAVILVFLGALLWVYLRSTRVVFAAFLMFALAALVYGSGLMLTNLTAFFDTPWADFVDRPGADVLLLLSLTSGVVLLIGGGLLTIIAAILGLILSGVGLARPPPPQEVPRPSITTGGSVEASSVQESAGRREAM